MKKVAMIVWNEFVNDARVLKEAQTLANSDYAVRVFALHTPGKTAKTETLQKNLDVCRVERSPLWRWRKSKQLDSKTPSSSTGKASNNAHLSAFRVISRAWTHLMLLLNIIRFRPTVVHSHDVNTLPTAWLASIISQAKLIYDAHEISTSREGYGKLSRLVAHVEKLLIPRASAVITTTETRAKYLARLYKIARPAVLQNRPRYVASQKSRLLHQALGIPEACPVVLYQGGLQSGRGLEKLVRCTSRLKNAHVVLIGGGRLTQPLIDLRDSLGLQDRVHFIPTVALSELPKYTAAADIAVQPIENTCFNHFSTDSNKLFEYIIAGVPSVATNFPEIRKIVNQYGIGLLATEGNEDDLVNCLNRLIEDPELRAKLAENSMIAAKDLCWESQENLLAEMYKKATSNGKFEAA
ncbi:glycosyltransferase [Pseudomonas putida]|uniref:glycosyltransferase n=1 Tax=Pseudomonas putida TaxID=303 RepID=UPI0024E0D468|nr:glycosyltransferase [Pseudomonas putida]HDS0965886.1 glycosyltransferase [Pseudomonas putida]HDS0991142.1 glycosyltransferase [Pseudomonas putida]